MPYGLKDIELVKLSEVFASNQHIKRVILYGSRAKGNYKPFSDIDITLEGNELTHTDLNHLSLAIDDLLLPYQFDISIFHTLKNHSLIDHIQRVGITIYERESEWKEYKLGEIADIQTGPFGSQLHMNDYQDEGTPIITVEHLGDNKIIHNNLPLVGDDDKNRLSKYILNEGDIVFSRVGSVDRRAYVSAKENGWLFSGRCLRVRPSQKVDSKFLSYYFGLEDFKETIRRIAVGATMPSINTSILSNLTITIPSLDTQKNIASILTSIDDKINLLHRENVTLEQIAETLFRQLFLEKEPKVNSVCLGDVIKTTSGGTPSRKQTEYYVNATIYWVKSKELNGSFISSTEELITEDAVTNSSAKILPEKTVLIAMYGATVGEYGILSKPMTCNQAICALIPNKKYPYTYLFIWAATMKQEFINLATGAAQQNISQDLIKQQYVCADVDLIKKYDDQARCIFDKMNNNNNQIITLIQLRDKLLYNLMNTEII